MLVIHPDDPTTDFLMPLYQDQECTVIRGGKHRYEILDLLDEHDRILMMGHGGWYGLHAAGAFPYQGNVIDSSMVAWLREKDCTFIWCYASDFTRQHGLEGFATGMFISEDWEALNHGVDATLEQIDESNETFADLMAKYDYAQAAELYGRLAKTNPVAAFNHARLSVGEPCAS